jgi:hypothetical protein
MVGICGTYVGDVKHGKQLLRQELVCVGWVGFGWDVDAVSGRVYDKMTYYEVL